jgi:hypothetical protein
MASSTTGQRRLSAGRVKLDAVASLVHADPAKALVMTHIGRLVAGGIAAWAVLENGDIQLRFNGGETFVLAETVIVRIA